MQLSFKGLVRKLFAPDYSDGTFDAAINNRGDVCVVQGLPPKTDIVRLGNTWHCCIATASAFTHVAAWPTTRAEIVLYNGESAGGKSYIIDSAWAANVATSIAAASAYTLIGQIVPGPVTAPTDDTAQLITSASGRGTNYSGKARRAIANTAFAVANKWEILNGAPSGAAGSIGLGIFAAVDGGLQVPPGAVLCLNLITGTATGTACIGVKWHEVQLPVA